MEQLIKYALVQVLYNEGLSYIDSIWPLVITSFENGEKYSIDQIQNNLEATINFIIPQHSLRTILGKLNSEYHYIEYNSYTEKFSLTEKGEKYVGETHDERDVKREIHSLIDDLSKFLKNKGYSIDVDKLEDFLNSFIKRNSLPLVEFLSPDYQGTVEINGHNKYDSIIAQYIFEIEKNNPPQYNIFKKLLLGSIILSIVHCENFLKLNENIVNSISSCVFYLDSNFIFSILKIHPESYSKPALELFSLLKANNTPVKVFNITIEEIKRVVLGYKYNHKKYIHEIPVDTIYYYLKEKNWKPSDILDFNQNLKQNLEEIGIEVDNSIILDLDNYIPTETSLKQRLQIEKSNEKNATINHDVAIIEKIREIRGNSFCELEKCPAIFLTSDNKLTHANLKMGHEISGTIPEVILDRVLTDILWLRNPKQNIQLSSLISAHSGKLLVNNQIWTKFYATIKELIDKKEITTNDVTNLIYRSRIEDDLLKFNEDDKDKINDAFILDKIDEANKNIETEINDKIESRLYDETEKNNQIVKENSAQFFAALEEKNNEISKINSQIDQLTSQIDQMNADEEKNNQRINELTEKNRRDNEILKEYISQRKENEKAKAKTITNVIRVILSLSSIGILYYLYILYPTQIGNIASIIGLIIVILAINIPNFYNNICIKIYSYLIKDLKTIEISE